MDVGRTIQETKKQLHAPPALPGARGAVSGRQQNAFLPPKGRKDSHHPMISEKATPVRHESDADVNKPGGCGNMSIKQRNYATSLSHALTTNSRSAAKKVSPISLMCRMERYMILITEHAMSSGTVKWICA